ncbi:MAG: signal recognition particle protein, partial [Pseudomonadota bacterium]
DQAEAEKMAKKMQEGSFDFDDLLSQLRNMKKMGGLGSVMSMMPGIGKIKEKMAEANIDDKILARQEAIILSMTKKERKNPKLLNGSRKQRIAAGSGTSVQEINKLFKAWQEMETMMKQMRKLGQKGFMRHGLKNLMQK